MGGLKEDIKHEIVLKQLKNVVKPMQYSWYIQSKNKATQKCTVGAYVGSRDASLSHRGTLPQSTRIS